MPGRGHGAGRGTSDRDQHGTRLHQVTVTARMTMREMLPTADSVPGWSDSQDHVAERRMTVMRIAVMAGAAT